ncbi:hypothetical protein ACHAPT_010817 [Fusarium lateritium]
MAHQSPHDTPPACCYRFQWGDFATLSYAWGDPSDSEVIVLNGSDTSITANLGAALRTFRRLGRFSGQFRLWADAICINQNDPEERGWQVATMRDIYAGSWTTMTFLGPATNDSSKALGLLKTLAAHEANKSTVQLRDALQDNPAYLGGHGEWLALQAFLQRPYWSRLWIVQEAALAPSNMPMFAGDKSITWIQVQDSLTSIHTCLWYVKDLCLQHDRRVLQEAQGIKDTEVSGIWDAANLHHIDKGPARLARKERRGEAITLADLLEVAYSTTCSEPVDKVYGLLAFMDRAIADQVIVDYGMQPSQLFLQVAQLFILHDNSLELLRGGSPWSQTGTPSWAPDWTWQGRNRDGFDPVLPYQCDGGRPAKVSFSADGRLLTVQGVVVDMVEQMGWHSTVELAQKDPARTIQEAGKFTSAYGFLSSTRNALYQTLMGGRLGTIGEHLVEGNSMGLFHLPESPETAMEEFKNRNWIEFSIQGHRYEQWCDWRWANDGIDLGDLGCVGDFFTDQIPAHADEASLWADFVRFRNVASGRTFVTTSKGRFGWVPESGAKMEVQRGDLFCIVFGCSVPLVIRRRGQEYQILGEGYLQGYMDGGILGELEAGRVVEELTFC